MTQSCSTDLDQGLSVVLLIGVVLLVEVVAFLLLARVGSSNPHVVSVVEIVLRFLLAALAVELVVNALADAGIITLAGG